MPSRSEINQPCTVVVIAPILPGASEKWRRYLQELTDSLRSDYEASRRRWGISRERVWLIETVKGVVTIMAVATTQPEQVVEQMAAGEAPFEQSFREQLLTAQGFDLINLSTQPLVELVFDWIGPTQSLRKRYGEMSSTK